MYFARYGDGDFAGCERLNLFAKLDVALRDVVAHTMAFGPMPSPARVRLAAPARSAVEAQRQVRWEVAADGDAQAVLAPRARVARLRARPLGSDTAAVLGEFTAGC